MRSTTSSHHRHGWTAYPFIIAGIVLVLVGLVERL